MAIRKVLVADDSTTDLKNMEQICSEPSSAVSGESVFAAETQDRYEDADLPRDFDRKPPALTRTWFVGTLAVALLAAMLHLFSPGSTGADSAHDRTSAPPVESPKPQPVLQQVLSIESDALALTVERPAGGEAPPGPENPNTRTHVVVRGDTLWDIAKKYVGDPSRYPELTELSNIRNPDLIHPSDIVRIEIRENRK